MKTPKTHPSGDSQGAEQNATKALEVANRVMVLSLGEAFLIQDATDLTTTQLKEGYRI